MKSRDKRRPPREREFIAWDGEGARDADNPKRQSYVILGNSDGPLIKSEELKTREMLAFIIAEGKRRPHAWHVAFAFDYDTNMILRNLTVGQFRLLRKHGSVKIGNYRIEHIPHKWFQVTHYGSAYPAKQDDKTTVRINDMFGFFQTSFIKALKAYIPNHPLMAKLDIIERGKALRNEFTYSQIDFITEYWTVEIELMRELANQLKEWLYDVNLPIKQWHGPGAIANFGYRQHGIKSHKSETSPEIYEAARYAYAGGRFERFQIGRFCNGWGIDINSAYPYGISKLPSLSEGSWSHNTNVDINSLVEFGCYHVRLSGAPIAKKAGPLFHRDEMGNISYPWVTEGWYWSPEVSLLRGMPGVEIIEGFEYTGWESRPFEFINGIYEQRREMKQNGQGSQMALKLFLNSLYGKMAQRVGWERKGGAPTWHQLEWAGYVTSATRAKLYAIMCRIPPDKLIAVETDGIYTTMDPALLGITDSKELGQWEVTPFDEIRYVQSGMYAKGYQGKWETKYRGLDANSINAWTLRKHLQQLGPNMESWPVLSGPTTRFVGYRQALWRQDMHMGPMKAHLCKWESTEKDLSAGSAGKRVHSPKVCKSCASGLDAWQMPHETIIKSRSLFGKMSSKHDIPWLDHDRPAWRDYQEGLAA